MLVVIVACMSSCAPRSRKEPDGQLPAGPSAPDYTRDLIALQQGAPGAWPLAMKHMTARYEKMNAEFGGALYAAPPPAALDKFYPPVTENREYKLRMDALYTPLKQMNGLLDKRDVPGARAAFERFCMRLDDVRLLVPEWTQNFGDCNEWRAGMTPLLVAGVRRDVQWGAFLILRAAHCEGCHQTKRSAVIARYHFPAFSKVEMPDVTKPGKTISFRSSMYALGDAGHYLRGAVEMQDWVAAKGFVRDMQANLTRSRVLCAACHGLSERKYFVDDDALARWQKVGQSLAAESPKSDELGSLIDDAWSGSCDKCHDVHMIPAKIQRSWALKAGEVSPLE